MASIEDLRADAMEENDSGRGWNLCRRPWWQQVSIQHHRSTPATSPRQMYRSYDNAVSDVSAISANLPAPSGPGILRALMITKRRLHFEPNSKLYFPYEPGKQSTSAIRIKNISHESVAFKFQTTAPKSCFMRPPNGVLCPGESIVATVVKFIELPKDVDQQVEQTHKRKTRDKFKVVTLKMADGAEFVPELFDEHKELAAVEQILRVVLLDPHQPSPQLHRLKALLAEADAAQQIRKKSQEQSPTLISNINEVNVLEEWKQRKLARQQANGVS